MKKHGKVLSDSQKLSLVDATDHLLPRPAEDEGIPVGVCNRLRTAVMPSRRISPADEWLLE
jgi:hypothetical protein